MTITPEKKILWISFGLIVVLVAAAYGLSLRNGLVWDDETFIGNNKFVHDLSRWQEYFTNPKSISDEPMLSKMYRPVQTLSFALDVRLWGTWIGGYHLTSLLLHIASCMAIIFMLRTLVGLIPAVTAACIFAVHPALSEGVLSLASRGNQLYTLFGLLSLGLFLRVERIFDRNHILSVAAMALALFSKEQAIAIVALLPLFQVFSGRPWRLRERRSVLLYAPFFAAAACYLAVRSAVVGTPVVMPYWGGSIWMTLMMQAKVFATYLRLLIWPFLLKGRYDVTVPAAFPDLQVLGAVLLNLAVIALGAFSRGRGARGKLISLAIAWFYISLAPVSNLIPIPGAMMGERFLYFTFAGVIPLLTGAVEIETGKGVRKAGIVLGSAVLVAFLAADVRRTCVWENNRTFFTLLSSQQPDDYAVQVRMAQVELASGDVASALPRLERLIQGTISSVLPEYEVVPHYWYGRALLEAKRFREAYREFAIVTKISPAAFKDVSLFLAEAAANSGDIAGARRILEGEVESSPDNDSVWNGLGNIQLMTKDIPGAISSYRRALQINPGNKQAAANLRYALEAGGGPARRRND
ncbi:MAG: tetratricopeptide repeat protein [Nitrospirae bacterium]|nr:tetratricopeptide repeat protein [Nitrospirota bacterium]